MKKTNTTLLDGRSAVFNWLCSITGRLTLFYTLSTFTMLFLATVFLYWTLKSDLELDENQFLADKINVIRSILTEQPKNQKALKEEVESEAAAHKFVKYYTRILDDEGHTLMETPHMSSILNRAIFPRSTDMQTQAVKWKSPDDKLYLLMSAQAELDHSTGGKRNVQIALDLSREEALISNYRHYVVIVLFTGIFLSAGVGIFIARKGLNPLTSITKAAQQISATKLHARIGQAAWPNELITLAREFDEMLKRLEGSFSRLYQLSADLAHELRSPINNLMGETEVALSRSRTPEEYRQVLGSNLEEFSRLSRIIDNLLFLARAENPDIRIERAWFDLDNKIEAVCEFFEALAEEKGVEIINQGRACINGDPLLFKRALSNILSNALQYTPEGGTITISIDQLEDQYVEVNVHDSGSGIDQEHISRVFDRFYRSDYARSQHPEGTGLGLAIVKSIMELHGGTVTVQSEPQKGTTFTLRFPILS